MLENTAQHLHTLIRFKDGRVQASSHEIDQLLCALVVNHELKKLNARKRASKSTKKGSRKGDDECDEDDE